MKKGASFLIILLFFAFEASSQTTSSSATGETNENLETQTDGSSADVDASVPAPETKASQAEADEAAIKAASDASEARPVPKWDGKVPESLLALGSGRFYSPYAFTVDKKDRSLTVWKNNNGRFERVAWHPADFGQNEGDKISLGDKKTPEGIYYFQEIYKAPRLNFEKYGSQAITMDYPNLFDRREGKTGSGIWLHAVPDDVSLYRGSRGCVVVRDAAIKELSKLVDLTRTPIIVLNSINYRQPAELKISSAQLSAWVESWRTAWQNKEIDRYISFYHPEFRSQKMDRQAWQDYKSGLNKKYEALNIHLSPPTVLRHKDEIVVRVLQSYRSDQHADFGEKTLYLKQNEGDWKIFAEEWKPVSVTVAKGLADWFPEYGLDAKSVALAGSQESEPSSSQPNEDRAQNQVPPETKSGSDTVTEAAKTNASLDGSENDTEVSAEEQPPLSSTKVAQKANSPVSQIIAE